MFTLDSVLIKRFIRKYEQSHKVNRRAVLMLAIHWIKRGVKNESMSVLMDCFRIACFNKNLINYK